MQIQNTDLTAFNGGYKFIRMPKTAREELPAIISKGKTIYENFEGKKGNVFMVTKAQFHDIVAAFIKKYKLNYRYYPEVKSEMAFKMGHPEKVSEIIKDMKPVEIVYSDKLEARMAHREQKQIVYKKSPVYTKMILSALKFDGNTEDVKTKNGVKIIMSKSGRQRIYISPPTREGVHYVRVEDLVSTPDSCTKRYRFASDGSYTEMADILAFNRLMSSTMIK